MKKQKCIVMFSGGLDSRLAIKIMQKKGFEILAVFFKLPFGTGCCNENCSFNFSQMQEIKLKVFDCTKGKLLQEYLNTIKKPKHGRGAGVNPCIDCRIFMFKKTKEFAEKNKIKFIATGEVLGQRPMSQRKKQIELIEKKSELEGRIIRPLIDFYKLEGRQRQKQMQLAKKFKIDFPSPAGGCLLCEKSLKERFKFLLKRKQNKDTTKLLGIGRHFIIDNCWVVLGRNQKENKILESMKKNEKIIPKFPAPTAIILDKCNEKTKQKLNELILAYSKKGSIGQRKKFERFKL